MLIPSASPRDATGPGTGLPTVSRTVKDPIRRQTTPENKMAGKKGQDNSKKAAGQSRKAEAAAQKAAAEEAKKAAAEAAEWDKGAKSNAKK